MPADALKEAVVGVPLYVTESVQPASTQTGSSATAIAIMGGTSQVRSLGQQLSRQVPTTITVLRAASSVKLENARPRRY